MSTFIDEALDGKMDIVRRTAFDVQHARSTDDQDTLRVAGKVMQILDVYAWDQRIVQMVKESAAKIPSDVPFSRDWLHTPCGLWWLGRQSALRIGTELAGYRQIGALTFWPVPTKPHLVHLLGHSYDGDPAEPAPMIVAAFELRVGQTVDDIMARLLRDQQRALAMTTEVTEKARHALEARGHVVDAENPIALLRFATQQGVVTKADTDHAAEGLFKLEHVKSSERLVTFFLAGTLWIQQEIAECREAPVTRASKRRAERLQIAPTVRVVELRARRYEHPPGEDGHQAVEWSCSWVVRGHWRKQPFKDGIRPIWIDPHVKGDTDKPLKGTDRVFAVRR